jgi:hypothetical protein
VSFVAITLCVASQRVIPKVNVYFIINSVQKLLDTPSYSDGKMYSLGVTFFTIVTPFHIEISSQNIHVIQREWIECMLQFFIKAVLDFITSILN